ncbi:MAG: SH3 domain-containing protein, partial [Sarcina sp.]
MGNQIETKVNPGDIVPGGFSHPNNATVSGDFLYLRDENGNQIAGRTVSDGDRITVLKVLSDKKLALIQYPAGSSVREGYVTNVVSIIKYDNLEKWVNGSTPEYVYETETSSEKIGSLDPREKATVLFKKGNRYNLVYNTSAGVRSKSGFVDYAGGSGGGSDSNGVRPGDVVPGGRTYPANAIVENDFLYLRDESGNQIAGRSVSIGDKITVLDISYSKQLALIQYPAGDVIRQGYVTNTTNIIRYLDEYNWYNGSTSETVYLNSTGNEVFGTLDAYESATKLYEKDGRVHVVYDTPKGMLTKSGYVNFGGLAVPPIGNVTIPSISASGVERIQYGTSGKGRALNAFKIGNGSKIMFAGFALHGFEDNWRHDGEALVKIATELVYKFSNYNGSNGLHGWTVYIA